MNRKLSPIVVYSILLGEWRVESGEWRVESGEWRVESGEWTTVGPTKLQKPTRPFDANSKGLKNGVKKKI
jgi:hypothetical protein